MSVAEKELAICHLDPAGDVLVQVDEFFSGAEVDTQILIDDSSCTTETTRHEGEMVPGSEHEELGGVFEQVRERLGQLQGEGYNGPEVTVLPVTFTDIRGHNKYIVDTHRNRINRRHRPGVEGIDRDAQQELLRIQDQVAGLVRTLFIEDDVIDGRQHSAQKLAFEGEGELLSTAWTKMSGKQHLVALKKICETVATIHSIGEKPLVHRDLKPANVMVNPNGEDDVPTEVIDPDLVTFPHKTKKGDRQGTEPFAPEMHPPADYPDAQAKIVPETDSYKLAESLAQFLRIDPRKEGRKRGDPPRENRGSLSPLQKYLLRLHDSADSYLPDERASAKELADAIATAIDNLSEDDWAQEERFHDLLVAEQEGDLEAQIHALEGIQAHGMEHTLFVLNDLALKKMEHAREFLPKPHGTAPDAENQDKGITLLKASLGCLESSMRSHTMRDFSLEMLAGRVSRIQAILADVTESDESAMYKSLSAAWNNISGYASLDPSNTEALDSLRRGVDDDMTDIRLSLRRKVLIDKLLTEVPGQQSPYENKERIEEVLGHIGQLEELEGSLSGDYHLLRGSLYEALDLADNDSVGQRLLALEEYKTAFGMDPTNEHAVHYLSRLQIDLEMHVEESVEQTPTEVALERMQKFADEHPLLVSPEYLLTLSEMYGVVSGKAAESSVALNEAYKRNPSDPEINAEQARKYLRRTPIILPLVVQHIKKCFCHNETEAHALLCEELSAALVSNAHFQATHEDYQELLEMWSMWMPRETAPQEMMLHFAHRAGDKQMASQLSSELFGQALPLPGHSSHLNIPLLEEGSIVEAGQKLQEHLGSCVTNLQSCELKTAQQPMLDTALVHVEAGQCTVSVPLNTQEEDVSRILSVVINADEFPEHEVLEVLKCARYLEMVSDREIELLKKTKRETEERVRGIGAEMQEEISDIGDQEIGPYRVITTLTQGKEMVGGDGVNMYKLDEHRTLISVKDVSGKDLPGALRAFQVVAAEHAAVRSLSRQASPVPLEDIPSEYLLRVIVEETDRNLSDGMVSRFIASTWAIIDDRTNEIVHINGGNPSLFFLSHDGARSFSAKEDILPLGVDAGTNSYANTKPSKTTVEPGTTMFMVTDGLTESPDVDTDSPDFLNVDGLTAKLEGQKGNPPDEVVAELLRITANSADNRTIAAVHLLRMPEPAESPETEEDPDE